jgi:hypothetical protein
MMRTWRAQAGIGLLGQRAAFEGCALPVSPIMMYCERHSTSADRRRRRREREQAMSSSA